MAQKNVTRDMTQGSPLKLILTFSLPLLGGFLFQQLYSFMDTMVVGGVLGTEALAAVGDTGSLNFLINGFCMGICSGFAIPIAQSSHAFTLLNTSYTSKQLPPINSRRIELCGTSSLGMGRK